MYKMLLVLSLCLCALKVNAQISFSDVCNTVPVANESVWGGSANNLSSASLGCTKIVFATSQTYDGNLGGVSGANTKCQDAATEGGLPGKYKAFLSGQVHASAFTGYTYIAQLVVPYVLIDAHVNNPYKVADDWSDLVSGTIQVSIKETEFGVSTSGTAVWTGLDEYGSDTGDACNGGSGNWTSNSVGDAGTVGVTTSATSTWTNNGPGACSSTAHLYCFQQ